MRKINKEGLDLIKKFEGLRLLSYQDVAGNWTIGYGHKNDTIRPGTSITPEGAEEFLLIDLMRTQSFIERVVHVPLTDNQFSALVCFIFNIGIGNFLHSTMLEKLNQNDYVAASEEFPKWDKVKGQEVKGLLERRLAEKALFLK